MDTPFVSVVTPAYNGAPYIEEAIQSVLAQTHNNFEYIICDNHSKDETGEIARSYAAKDARIKVVSPPTFLPQAKNFNYALSHMSASSRYLKILHADDWLFPDCVRQMMNLAQQDPRIALVSSYRLIETTPDCFGLPHWTGIFPARDVLRLELLGKVFPFGTSSTVMWRADVVRRRAPSFFPEDRLYFDIDAIYRNIADEHFGFVHQVLTFTRYQAGALQDKTAGYNTWFMFIQQLIEAYGKEFLTPEEFAARYEEVSSTFYRGMGEVWIKDRVRKHKRHDFWAFQQKHLAAVGKQIDKRRLAMGVVDAGLYLATHLGETMSKATNKLRQSL